MLSEPTKQAVISQHTCITYVDMVESMNWMKRQYDDIGSKASTSSFCGYHRCCHRITTQEGSGSSGLLIIGKLHSVLIRTFLLRCFGWKDGLVGQDEASSLDPRWGWAWHEKNGCTWQPLHKQKEGATWGGC
jgi:hypothetical protein